MKIEEKLKSIEELISDINSPPNQIIYSTIELSKKLNVSIKTLQKWRDKGYLKYTKIDRCIFYKLSDVLVMMERFSISSLE